MNAPVDKNCFRLLDMLGTPNCIGELIHALGFPVCFHKVPSDRGGHIPFLAAR